MAKSKLKVPKKVAGVKVPKKLRKRAKRAIELAENPAVRELALAGIAAAAAAIVEKAQTRKTAKPPAAPRPEQPEAEAIAESHAPASDLADLIQSAALEGARRLLEGASAPARKGNGVSPSDDDSPE